MEYLYKPIEPPVTFNYIREATKKEGKEFFEWFMSVKDERIRILEKAVQTTPGFENWKADFTPKSLCIFDEWLPKVAELRSRTEEEIATEKKKLLPQFKNLNISTETLTGRSISLAFDVGIYMGEVFIHNNPELEWAPYLKTEFIYNNQPVIQGFGKPVFAPWSMLQSRTAQAALQVNIGLLKLYEIWVNMYLKK